MFGREPKKGDKEEYNEIEQPKLFLTLNSISLSITCNIILLIAGFKISKKFHKINEYFADYQRKDDGKKPPIIISNHITFFDTIYY